MTTTVVASRQQPQAAGSERHVTFLLAGQIYAVPALSVREVITWIPATRVPHGAPSVKGVIDLRGEVVVVLDLRVRLNLPPVEPTDRTCIIVVAVQRGEGRLQAGLIVDTALDVTRIPSRDIETRKEGVPALADEAVAGVARTKAGLTILLDLEHVVLDGLASA